MLKKCRVIKTENDKIFVQYKTDGGDCGSCTASCHSVQATTLTMTALSDITCENGDWVMVEMPKGATVLAVLSFLIPIALLGIGLLSGYFISGLFMALLGIGFFVAGVGAVVVMNNKLKTNKRFKNHVVAKTDDRAVNEN